MDKQDRELVVEARKVQAQVYAALVERLGPVELELLVQLQLLGTGANLLEQRVRVRGPNFSADGVRKAMRAGIKGVRTLM